MQASQAQAAQVASQREETKSFARDSDGLDSVSQVSVSTPKSRRSSVSRPVDGDSVSYVTYRTNKMSSVAPTSKTNVSTKIKLE